MDQWDEPQVRPGSAAVQPCDAVYYSLVINDSVGHQHADQWVRSVASLRKYNPTIPVWLLVYDSIPDGVYTAARCFSVTIVDCGGYAQRLEALIGAPARALAHYPTLHKFLALDALPSADGGRFLYLDCDTCFFGDVQQLFTQYRQCAFYAREEPYSSLSYLGYDSWAIDEAALLDLTRSAGLNYVRPFNSGVCLFNDSVRRQLLSLREEFLQFAWRLLIGLYCGPTRPELNPELVAEIAALLHAGDAATAIAFPSGNRWIVAQVALWLTLGRLQEFSHGRFSAVEVAQNGELIDFRREPWDGVLVAHYFTSHQAQFEEWLRRYSVAERFACSLAAQPTYLTPRRGLQRLRSVRAGSMVLNSRYRLEEDVPNASAQSAAAQGITGSSRLAVVTDPDFGTIRYRLDAHCMQTLLDLREGRIQIPDLDPDTHDVLCSAGFLVPGSASQSFWSPGELSRIREHFRTHGYAQISGALHPYVVGTLRAHYRGQVRRKVLSFGDDQSPLRFVQHEEPAAAALHLNVGSLVSSIVGKAVTPSYVYVAAYQGGAQLPPHVDREQCEFTASVLVDFTPEEAHGAECPWPLELHTRRGRTAIFQEIGDALLFRGREIVHSRPPLPADMTSTSVLFHFVEQEFSGHPK